ncbi:MAG TPA: M14 family zinc carboxypeptidase, partial [Chitinophagaceae bacterium]|nr:M14 family zinc carboxypeptidase [Chitinophagaceae bacterium]
MKPIRVIVFLLIAFSFFTVHAQQKTKYSKVRVYYTPSDTDARNNILGLLEIDHFQEENGAIISEIDASLLKKLKASNIKFDVLADDVAKDLQEQNKAYNDAKEKGVDLSGARVALEWPGNPVSNIIAVPTAFTVQPTLGGYYSFPQMEAAMTALVAAYPTIASKTSLGKTYQNRDIWVIKISDNVATDETNEPEVLYMGLQHAREAITGASMIYFMQYLCEQYSKDTRIKNLVDNREIFIIPCFNPDGWEYNRSTDPNGGGDWRKNRKPNAGGSFGVDLNRNWGVDWGNCSAPISGPASSCGTSDPTQDTYWGTGAFSELENQAVRTFTQSHHLVAGFDQHAYGPYYSLPFGRHSLHTMSPKGINFYTAIPALMATYNGMRAADSYDALGYEVAGGFKDWMLMGNIGTGTKDTVYALTGEGAAGGGTPAFGAAASFWAPSGQIISLCRSMCYQNLQLAYATGSYVDLQDVSDIAVTALNGSFNFSVQRLGLGNDPVTVSLIPLENIQSSGSAVTISSLPGYYETYNGSISYNLFPALGTGQRIKFIWKVATGGYTYSDTITKFYNPTQLLYDDMESPNILTTNWSNPAPSTLASGFGYNYTSGSFVFTTSGGYGGGKALSESAANTNYTTKAIKICQYKTTFNLTGATAAYLSFWTRYRAENFRDRMQVLASTNGTAWTALRGSTTIEEPGTLDDATLNGTPALTGIHDYWTHEIFNLSAYDGNATVYLRFQFTSDDDPSSFKYELDDGFYIDNVKVIKSNATFLNLLPVNFINFYGNLLAGKKIGLNWEAVTDKSHNYFEVEKSADAVGFTSIGKIASGAPF